jgi:MSHA biogenesis protein MshP
LNKRGWAATKYLPSALGPLSSESGFSLVTAIFLLVVLSGLGAAMMTFFTAQQQGSALDVLGARAYQASRAGIEWGAYQVVQNSGVGFAPNCQPGPTAQSLPALAGTLAEFTVSVSCSATSAVEAAATVWVYSLTSTAARGTAGSADYVERQISATLAQ